MKQFKNFYYPTNIISLYVSIETNATNFDSTVTLETEFDFHLEATRRNGQIIIGHGIVKGNSGNDRATSDNSFSASINMFLRDLVIDLHVIQSDNDIGSCRIAFHSAHDSTGQGIKRLIGRQNAAAFGAVVHG